MYFVCTQSAAAAAAALCAAILRLAAAVRHRAPATRGSSSYKQQ